MPEFKTFNFVLYSWDFLLMSEMCLGPEYMLHTFLKKDQFRYSEKDSITYP